MSPLATILLRMLRGGAFAAAGFIALVIGIEIWKRGGDVAALNMGFTLFLALLLAAALWLARAIGRELARHGAEHGS